MLVEQESIRQRSQTLVERGYTFGYTGISLIPFILSSIFVFLSRIQWAIVSTIIGFTILLIVLNIFLFYYVGEQSRNLEDLTFLRERLDENQRQFDMIQNQTIDKSLSINEELKERSRQENKTVT